MPKSLKLCERLILLTPHLYKKWGLIGLNYQNLVKDDPWEELDTLVGVGPKAALEHLLHEMAHAVDLGLTLGPGLSSRVSKKCLRIPGQDPEARAWAIEYLTWQYLKLPFEWADAAEGARIQDVADGHVEGLLEGRKGWEANQPKPIQLRTKARIIVQTLKSEEIQWIKEDRPHNIYHKYRNDLLSNKKPQAEFAS